MIHKSFKNSVPGQDFHTNGKLNLEYIFLEYNTIIMDYYDSNNNILLGCAPTYGDNIQIGTEPCGLYFFYWTLHKDAVFVCVKFA